MIVRLTKRQVEVIDKTVQTSPTTGMWRDAFADWIDKDIQRAPKHRVDVAMPAQAWELVQKALFNRCYNTRGFRTKGVLVSELNSLKAVQQSLNVRMAHPALNGIAAIGMVSELIPAWLDPDEGTYSPFPLVGPDAFTILAPVTVELGQGRKATKWVPTDSRWDDRSVLDEAEHWRFTQYPLS